MKNDPWYRYYVETPTDLKIKRAAVMIKCERIFVNGAWSAVMTMAKKSPIEGTLLIAKDIPATVYEIADFAGTENIELLEALIKAFIALDMIQVDANGTLFLPHWNERQYKSDSSTPRVREFRDKKRNVSRNGNGNVSLKQSETDQSQSRAESDQNQNRTEADKNHPPQINVFTLYENEIGPLTPMISDALQEAEKTYPNQWFPTAFKEAADHNARNWKYIEAILRNWKDKGLGPSRPNSPPPKRDAEQERLSAARQSIYGRQL